MSKASSLCFSAESWADSAFQVDLCVIRAPRARGLTRSFSPTSSRATNEIAVAGRAVLTLRNADWRHELIHKEQTDRMRVVEDVPHAKVEKFRWQHNLLWNLSRTPRSNSIRARFVVEP